MSYTNPEPNASLLPVSGTPFIIITSLGLDLVVVICTTEFSTFLKTSGNEVDDGDDEGRFAWLDNVLLLKLAATTSPTVNPGLDNDVLARSTIPETIAMDNIAETHIIPIVFLLIKLFINRL